MILHATNTVVSGSFAGLFKKGDVTEIARLARRSCLFSTAACMPIMVFVIAFPELTLSLFGEEYAEGAVALQTLAAGQIAVVTTGPVIYILMMTGYEAYVRIGYIVALVLTVVSASLVVPELGAFGAALSVAIPTILLNVAAAIIVYRKLSFVVLPKL
jgi:O-antigen/teichoic acid export membrane protein